MHYVHYCYCYYYYYVSYVLSLLHKNVKTTAASDKITEQKIIQIVTLNLNMASTLLVANTGYVRKFAGC